MDVDDQHDDSESWRRPPVDLQGEDALRARQDLLTYRDHVIGLEAESASLQQQVDKMSARQRAQRERIEELREKLDRQRNRADRLQRELAALRAEAADTGGGRRRFPRFGSE